MIQEQGKPLIIYIIKYQKEKISKKPIYLCDKELKEELISKNK